MLSTSNGYPKKSSPAGRRRFCCSYGSCRSDRTTVPVSDDRLSQLPAAGSGCFRPRTATQKSRRPLEGGVSVVPTAAVVPIGQPSPYLTIGFPNFPPQDQDAFDLERLPKKVVARWKEAFLLFLRQLSYRSDNRPRI